MKLYTAPFNKRPKGGRCEKLVTADGTALRTAIWRVPGEVHKGTVCLLQGRIEFIEKYYEVIGELTSRGFDVVTLDWRGQGGSDRLIKDRLRGHVENFDHYLSDFKQFMEELVMPTCRGPFYALAHSMGGHILLRSMAQHNWFERSVAVSPMVAIAMPHFSGGFVETFVDILTVIGLKKQYVPNRSYVAIVDKVFRGNLLSSDQMRFERTRHFLLAHPELEVGPPTNGWLSAALDSVEALNKTVYPLRRKRSVLLFSAGYDQIVSNRAIEEFAKRTPGISHIVIDGSRHEILMEADAIREQFWSAFDAFIPGGCVDE